MLPKKVVTFTALASTSLPLLMGEGQDGGD